MMLPIHCSGQYYTNIFAIFASEEIEVRPPACVGIQQKCNEVH
jgi:hypothetical protein